jgi:hypothetical protein
MTLHRIEELKARLTLLGEMPAVSDVLTIMDVAEKYFELRKGVWAITDAEFKITDDILAAIRELPCCTQPVPKISLDNSHKNC